MKKFGKMELIDFYIVAPSTVKVGEKFKIRFKLLTHPYKVEWRCYTGKPPKFESIYNLSPRGIHYMDNVLKGWNKKIVVEVEKEEIEFDNFKGVFSNDERCFGEIEGISFSTPGVKFIKIKDPASGKEKLSNPILVEENLTERLYWADLHSQTFFSDGLRCPEELYFFAKEEAFLDIFSISDHAEALSDQQWNYFKEVTNNYNEDEKFITLIALEWTDGFYGHRNIYYPGEDGPILRRGEDDLKKVYEIAEKYKALVIPHHSANTQMGVDWSKGHNPDVERLVEIYSIWGNSEKPESEGNTRPIRNHGGEKKGQHVIDALNRGYKFGFVGGGDIHDGRPGDELHNLQEQPPQYRNLYRQGITGIWAEKLTRKEVFTSLWQRNCYATSNVRVILKFFMGEYRMGSIVKEKTKKIPFKIFAASEIPIKSISVIKNGIDWKKFEFNKRV
ncbi:DUF3604 domain-containing protein, partial [bacterium]|nr:DUF3604 domain-containing protein [bacterium]